MSDFNEKFCAAPFTNLSISPKGLIRTCCLHNLPWMYERQNIKDDTQEIEWPTKHIIALRSKMLGTNVEKRTPECKPCWDSEKADVRSYRQKYNSYYAKKEYVESPTVKSLDIQFGSLCNLSCLMCGPTYSSHLFNTRKRLEKISTNKKLLSYYKDTNMSEDNFDWTMDPHSFSKLLKIAETTEDVSITGGEPIFNPKLKVFLKFLLTKKIPVRYFRITTNATVYDQEVIDLIGQFPNVQFKISLEGLREVDEFIRWPTVWSTKEENIKKFIQNFDPNKVKILFSTVIQALNLFHLNDIRAYIDQLNYTNKAFQFQLVQDANVNSLRKANPVYLTKYIHELGDNISPVKIDYSKNIIGDIRMQVAFYNDMAKIQNKSLKDIFPIYYEYHKDFLNG